MRLLLNNLFVAVFILFGTMSLQAQQTDSPQQQQEDQEISDLIDRLDNLMARALKLDDSQFDETRRQGVDVERETDDMEQDQDEQERVGVQRDGIGQATGDQQKRDKMVKRFRDDLGLTIGSMKNAAERYQELLTEDSESQTGQTGVGVPETDTDTDTDVQTDEQQNRQTAEQDEERRESLDQMREHLLTMADELEKAVETVEKLSSGSERPGQTQFDTEY